jgi:hypothetical protein
MPSALMLKERTSFAAKSVIVSTPLSAADRSVCEASAKPK